MNTPSEWKYKAATEWNDQEDGQNQVVMDLEFDLQNLLSIQAAKNEDYQAVFESLEDNKTEVRQEIFRVADVHVLPEILNGGADTMSVPVVPNNHKDISTSAKVRIDADYQTSIKNGQVGIRNEMKLFISMDSNMDLSSVQALESVRHGVASAIENNIVFNLELAFQGKKEFEVENSWSGEDTERVESYRTEDVKMAA